MGLIDWATEKVQNFTGETERRQLVSRIKRNYTGFRNKVTEGTKSINSLVGQYNKRISVINNIRSKRVEHNIMTLSKFLAKFGNIKSMGYYVPEQSTEIIEIPERQFEHTETYIKDVDSSKEKIFDDTYEDGLFGTRSKNRANNISMREWLDKFKISSEHTVQQLKTLKYTIKKNKDIADLYIFCIGIISEYIDKVILPELDVVEAFFQVINIKNTLIIKNEMGNFKPILEHNAIEILNNTQYHRHYLFVKNTFMFYVISCKIYNTPILTQLISSNDEKAEANYEVMKKYKEALVRQKNEILNNLVFVERTNKVSDNQSEVLED